MDGQRDQARQLMQLIRADKKCKRKKGEREKEEKILVDLYFTLPDCPCIFYKKFCS